MNESNNGYKVVGSEYLYFNSNAVDHFRRTFGVVSGTVEIYTTQEKIDKELMKPILWDCLEL